MASRTVTLNIRPRGKPIQKLPETTPVPLNESTAEIYKSLAKSTGYSIHRLRVTKGNDGSVVPNSKDVSVESTGLRDRSTIVVKDLGPQISWRLVYVVEYLGPLVIHPTFYYLRPYIYPLPSLSPSKDVPPPSNLQTICMILITLHFMKRELETIFIHRFSAATMPATFIIRNSAHYWLLSGLNLAYWIYAPTSPAQTAKEDPRITYAAVALWVIAELGNLNAHLVLRNLRKPGTTERGIPRGIGFNLVTCPNYMFEVFAWLAVGVLSRSWSSAVFLSTAVFIMTKWAWKRERRYRKEFPGKYKKKRFAILPGIM